MLIKSKLKYIQSLGQKKPRDEEGVFIAEGPKLVNDLLSYGRAEVKEIFALKSWLDVNKKYIAHAEATEVSEEELNRISQLSTPNQVLAVVKKMDWGNTIQVKNKITPVLQTIQDPGNLGTIIRTADWFGIEQIVCSHDCADVYNPKVVQATMGSIARVKIFYTDLPGWMSRQKDIRIYATALQGKDISQLNKLREGIIIIGNEAKGVSKDLLELSNVKITIPGKGKAESLNAAVATGIILHQIC